MQQALHLPSTRTCLAPRTSIQPTADRELYLSRGVPVTDSSKKRPVRMSAVQRSCSPPRPPVERLSVPEAAPIGKTHPDALKRRKEAEERKRSRQQYIEATASGKGWWEIANPSNLHVVASREEFNDRVRLAKRENRLVVVDYFAPWCHACKSLHPKLQKLAQDYQHVTFLSVNAGVDSLKAMCEDIGVPKLPYFHFLKGTAGVVAEFSASLTADRLRHLRSQVSMHSAQ